MGIQKEHSLPILLSTCSALLFKIFASHLSLPSIFGTTNEAFFFFLTMSLCNLNPVREWGFVCITIAFPLSGSMPTSNRHLKKKDGFRDSIR